MKTYFLSKVKTFSNIMLYINYNGISKASIFIMFFQNKIQFYLFGGCD